MDQASVFKYNYCQGSTRRSKKMEIKVIKFKYNYCQGSTVIIYM